MKRFALAVALVLGGPVQAYAKPVSSALWQDPAVDAKAPARMVAFQLPVDGAKINAVFYLAAGSAPHPTLLLLHGFPGNEQNLDLAQAARRAGWNVLTLHYRGSWGSEGAFSFAHCAQDAATAARWLQKPEIAKLYRIDPRRIAVAGHSMGGMMAARTMAEVSGLRGAFLIDPWDIAEQRRQNQSPASLEDFRRNELEGDLPPLSGTSAEALLTEISQVGPEFDLTKTVGVIADRPLALIYAKRGIGGQYGQKLAAAKGKHGPLTAALWPTDHSFSDHRLKLTALLLQWLGSLR
ncbi:alpha/beta fold hydrolase [Novosphingobium umbonatum]|uniref:Alpha/beta fold hydrolase n=1 Tax=Novosphingobium umbonatum TaxID=1908524 RepID=A0A3S2USF2_9SPHN|nr:alpha/beta fold hydrolase [Novosphingobium umbonatum]RVU03592.1 alpha/beta fold hydrolase [Novosphingobium umbonatum]